MTSKWVEVVVGAGLLGRGSSCGLVAGLAHAEGIPAANALTYTGWLETPPGASVTP